MGIPITQLATKTRAVTTLSGDPRNIIEVLRAGKLTGELRIVFSQGGISLIQWEMVLPAKNGLDSRTALAKEDESG